MRWLVASSLRFHLLVLPLAAAMMIVGVAMVREAPVDVLPQFSPPYVEVQTEALGLSAEEVEELITVPLERDLLNGVAGIDVIRSESVLGLSSVVLVFERGTNLLNARQLVQERLLQAHVLPNVSKPPTMLQPLSSQSRVVMIGLSSKEVSPIEMGVLARWTIRPRLMGVPGVANVVIWGQREHQLQVRVDPQRLRRENVSLQQVISTAGNAQLVSPLSFLPASTPGTGGFIDTPNQRLQVRHILPIADPKGLGQVPVEGTKGLRLGEVADIVVDHQPLIGDAVVDGEQGMLLVVEKFPGANTLEVTRNVEAALDAMRPGLSGLELDSSVFRPANYIESAVENLGIALLIGALLLAFVLAALFFSGRMAVIGLISISLSLVTALLVLALRGETMNALVLVGLLVALGVVVDDAVVAVDSIRRRLRLHREAGTGMPTPDLVHEATLEARAPLGYATLILLIALVPVFFLGSLVDDFFRPLAVSYGLAVLASMAVALTLTPALALLLLGSNGVERREPPLLRRLAARYGTALGRIIRRPHIALAALGVAAVVALALGATVDRALVPTLKERELLIHIDGAPGVSRAEMMRLTGRMSTELRSIPGVENVGAHIGRAVMSDETAGVSSGELWVSLDSQADYDAMVGRIEGIVGDYPGVRSDLVTYSTDRIRAIGSLADGKVGDDDRVDGLAALRGDDEPLVVRVYGNALDRLRRKAGEVRAAMASVEGVVNPRIEPSLVEPMLEITPNVAAARRHGIKPGDIRRAAAALVQGIEIGSLFEGQKVFDVLVVGVPELRHSVSSVGELRIDKPDGGQVPLAEVADVRVAPTPMVIRREATSRRIDVVADVSGRDLDAVVGDVERRLDRVAFPLEYHAEVLDASSERRAADIRALTVLVAAAVAILLLLQAAFGSWRLALVFFAGLAAALAGGVLAAVLTGELSLGAAAGLLLLFGTAVRSAVILVDRCRRLQRAGAALSAEVVLQGAGERFRPVITSALATAAVVSPFLVLGNVPGQELAFPFALVVVAGLVTTTLFTLFLVPPLYLLFGAVEEAVSGRELADELVRQIPPEEKRAEQPRVIQPI
jgi:Cu/Ag efflux pump CusA